MVAGLLTVLNAQADRLSDYDRQIVASCMVLEAGCDGAEGMQAKVAVGTGGKVIGLNRFGESAPAGELFKAFGFTVDNVVKAVEDIL